MFELLKGVLDAVEAEQRKRERMTKTQLFFYDLGHDWPLYLILLGMAAVSALACYGAIKLVVG